MKDTSLEELVEAHEKAKAVIEETEAGMKVIKDEILDRLKAMKLTGVKTKTGYFVRSVITTSFSSVPMDWARENGATVQKESLDLSMLRQLQAKGVKVPEMKVVKYVKITEGDK